MRTSEQANLAKAALEALRPFAFFLLLFSLGPLFSAEENFLLVNGVTDERILELGPHIDEPITPCSTFKIVLSLIGHQEGILKDKRNPSLDYQEGYDNFLASWRASQTPESWIRNSCIWYSRLLASQLGSEKMDSYLALFNYGNQDMSGGLTGAWLSSSLKISPREQVEFIQKMVQGKLPVSNNAVQMTTELLFKEDLPDGWKLYGKTGKGLLNKESEEGCEVAWLVGWVENEQNLLLFAYNRREKAIPSWLSLAKVKELLTRSPSYFTSTALDIENFPPA